MVQREKKVGTEVTELDCPSFTRVFGRGLLWFVSSPSTHYPDFRSSIERMDTGDKKTVCSDVRNPVSSTRSDSTLLLLLLFDTCRLIYKGEGPKLFVFGHIDNYQLSFSKGQKVLRV